MRKLYIISIIAILPLPGMATDDIPENFNKEVIRPHTQIDSTDIISRIDAHDSRLRTISAAVWTNPAMRPFEFAHNYTTVSIGYNTERQSESVCSMAGNGQDRACFNAETYIKHGHATLWGQGCYSTGRRKSVIWNEVADADMIYPYITADATGGDIESETYRFSGGYAGYNGQTTWGATLGYTAGQHYRDIDPRPRNITGRLDITAGIGRRISGKYIAAISGEFMKYKQTSDIDFKNETGHATIYHLTGLGNDYVRFRGNGMTTLYDGKRYAAQLNIAPTDGNGMSATLRLSHMTIETILDDINRLPMTELWHKTLYAELAYQHKGTTTSWGASAGIDIFRRHGKENIFSDAASATYPQIGTIEIYADNGYSASARGLIEHRFKTVRLTFEPSLTYSHRSQIYLEPPREWYINSLAVSQRMMCSARIGRHWHAKLTLTWALCRPVESHFVTEDFFGIEYNNDNEALMTALLSDFRYASATIRTYSADGAIRYSINSRNALQLSATFRHDSYTAGTTGNTMNINAGIIF